MKEVISTFFSKSAMEDLPIFIFGIADGVMLLIAFGILMGVLKLKY